MQSFATGLSRARIRRQSGSVAMLGALWLMIAVICLATIDIGNVFWQKRELQKIADLAALAGASGDLDAGACEENSVSNAVANAGKREEVIYAKPGRWVPEIDKESYFYFTESTHLRNACRVKVERQAPFFFIFSTDKINGRMIFAEATAMQLPKVAKIGIKSTLAEINSENSPLLNSVVGGLLGGNISVSAVGWNGLLGAEIGLLDFLKQLAINLKLDAGDFNKLLDTRVSVGQVITALVDVMEKQGPAANIAVGALKDILALGVKLDKLQLNISELLNIQAGMSSSALKTNVNLFELVQSTIQVGNGNSAVAGQVDIPIPGLVNATIRIKAIEKPQFSAIGDPDLAKISPTGVNKIYVRTAQIRALLSIKLPVADALVNFLNLLADILQVIALDIDLLPGPIRLDVGIDAGGGRAYVTDYRCDAGKKS